MDKFYSRTTPSTLLHIVFRRSEIGHRVNIAPDEEFLQCAAMRLAKGQTFRAHMHVTQEKVTNIAQESWLVVQGRVKCIFYDLDDSLIAEPILEAGDISMTFRGGHNYLVLDDDTIVYEYKTGPYLGQEFDKTFLNENQQGQS